jgi:hypothetical protein
MEGIPLTPEGVPLTKAGISFHDEWEECPHCLGEEGHMEGEEWVDCEHCEGQGGWAR